MVSDADSFHIDNLCARQLVSVLDRTLADLLVANRADYSGFHGAFIPSLAEIFVSLVSILVSLCSKIRKRYITCLN